MKTSYSTNTLLSFTQYVDNRLQQEGQGFFNTTSRLFYQPDPRLGNSYVCYASPFKSWVWDSGVSGAAIGGVVSGSLGIGGTGSLSRGQSGMMVDYVNGRVIFPAAIGTNAVISGTYAVKELNTYVANQSQEKLVFTDKYYLNPRFDNAATGAPPILWDQKLRIYNLVTPCVFISNVRSENEPWALGGLYNTTQHVTLNVLAETLPQLEGVLQLMIDSQDACFPLLPTTAWPLNAYGDFKGGTGYNYETIKTQFGQASNLFMVTDVQASKVGDGVKIDDAVYIGVCDVTLQKPRTIH